MKPDHYAILGVSPTAEQAVIRAAYLALVRLYHPDRNGSPEAAERTRAINRAYKELGDPGRRAGYDAERAAFRLADYGSADAAPGRARRHWPAMAFAAGLAAFAGAAIVLIDPAGSPVPPRLEVPDKVSPRPAPVAQPAEPAPGRVADLLPPSPPPNVADLIPEDLATPVPDAFAEAPAAQAPEPRPRPVVRAPANARPPVVAEARPPAAPGAVPPDANLATIERQAALLYDQSVRHADAARRSRLATARSSFQAARGACRTDACLTDLALGHMREVVEIMQARSPAF